MEDVGREVRRLREERGWSQAKLAAGADMAVSGISQIETGVRSPSAATLTKLARAFGVEVADLFPKAEPLLWSDEPREQQPFNFREARKGIEEYCEHWERIVSEGKLDLDAIGEFSITGMGFLPVIDIALATELHALHRATGLEGRELRASSDIAHANRRYLALLGKVMKVAANGGGEMLGEGDPEKTNVIHLEEVRKRLADMPGEMFG